MIGAAVVDGVTQFVQYGNPNATGRKNTTMLPNGTGCAAKISRRFWLWLDSIASSIGRIENAARIVPTPIAPTVTSALPGHAQRAPGRVVVEGVRGGAIAAAQTAASSTASSVAN